MPLKSPSGATPSALSEVRAGQATDKITQTVDNLLSSSMIHHCPIHVVPALFAAMGMHTIDICHGNSVRKQLGYVRIRLCMIALEELKSTWPVSGWIFMLFTKIVSRIGQRDRSLSDPQGDVFSSSDTAEGSSRVDPSTGIVDLQQAQPMVVSREDDMPIGGWDQSILTVPLDFPADWGEALNTTSFFGSDFDWLGLGYSRAEQEM